MLSIYFFSCIGQHIVCMAHDFFSNTSILSNIMWQLQILDLDLSPSKSLLYCCFLFVYLAFFFFFQHFAELTLLVQILCKHSVLPVESLYIIAQLSANHWSKLFLHAWSQLSPQAFVTRLCSEAFIQCSGRLFIFVPYSSLPACTEPKDKQRPRLDASPLIVGMQTLPDMQIALFVTFYTYQNMSQLFRVPCGYLILQLSFFRVFVILLFMSTAIATSGTYSVKQHADCL